MFTSFSRHRLCVHDDQWFSCVGRELVGYNKQNFVNIMGMMETKQNLFTPSSDVDHGEHEFS